MVSAIIAAGVSIMLALLGFTWFLSANLATIKGKISSIERYLWGDKTKVNSNSE